MISHLMALEAALDNSIIRKETIPWDPHQASLPARVEIVRTLEAQDAAQAAKHSRPEARSPADEALRQRQAQTHARLRATCERIDAMINAYLARFDARECITQREGS
jgi:hypothetical protein